MTNIKQAPIAKFQIPNPVISGRYDLETRSLTFARSVNEYVTALPKTVVNLEIGKQLVRAGGSVGANYIEANESLGKKRFRFADADSS